MSTLRQFVERTSDTIEKVFRRIGMIRPMFHVVQRDGNEFVIPGDLSDNKDLTVAMARAAFKMCDAVRYLFVDEAWTVMVTGPDADRLLEEVVRSGASNHPQRQEIIMISAEDEAEGQLLARRTIIRPKGAKPYLGPLVIDTETRQSEGRFVGLLPQRATVH